MATIQDLLDYLKAKDEKPADPEKEAALQDIRNMGRQSFAHIGFYNNIAEADTLAEGVLNALESQRELYDMLLNFTGLLAGFTFVGLPLGDQPDTYLQAVAYFILILGFGANMVAALMAFIATLCIKGLQNETWQCVNTTFFKWGKIFYLTNFLAVGGAGCLLVGVNVLVHDFFTDRDDIWCWRKGAESTEGGFDVVPADAPSTGFAVQPVDPDVSYCHLGPGIAISLNVLSGFFFVVLSYIFYGSIMAKQAYRRISGSKPVSKPANPSMVTSFT